MKCVVIACSGSGIAEGRPCGADLGDDARISRVAGLSSSPVALSSFSVRMVLIRVRRSSAVCSRNSIWESEYDFDRIFVGRDIL